MIKTTNDIIARKDSMPTHRKNPIFLRVITNDDVVVCINPSHLSSFRISEKDKIRVKGADGKEEVKVTPTIRFYFPSGTGLSYSVDVDITQQEFIYVCGTLLEYVYLNEAEFKARHEAIGQERMAEWEALSKENEAKIPPTDQV